MEKPLSGQLLLDLPAIIRGALPSRCGDGRKLFARAQARRGPVRDVGAVEVRPCQRACNIADVLVALDCFGELVGAHPPFLASDPRLGSDELAPYQPSPLIRFNPRLADNLSVLVQFPPQ